MKNWCLLLLMITVLNSCMWGVPKKQGSEINTDTLAYTYQTIKKRASDCGTKPDSGCTFVSVQYPEFKSNAILNDSVKTRLFNLFWADTKPAADTDLQKYAGNFIDVYEKNKDDATVKGLIFTAQSSAKILRQDSSLVTFKFNGYVFQGGAHGNTITYFFNWNTKTNRPVLLNDILVNGYNDRLTTIGETIFRKNENLSDTASLARDYFFKGNKFALNNNFLITPLGLRFLYNQYEIKPYAAGQTDLLIPYTKIKSLLLPHTVVSQYIK